MKNKALCHKNYPMKFYDWVRQDQEMVRMISFITKHLNKKKNQKVIKYPENI